MSLNMRMVIHKWLYTLSNRVVLPNGASQRTTAQRGAVECSSKDKDKSYYVKKSHQKNAMFVVNYFILKMQ